MTSSTIVSIVNLAFIILELLILARVLLTWFPVSPWNRWARLLRRIVDPILSPFRRLLPTFGGMDFSPLLALAVIYVANQVIDSLILTQNASLGTAILEVVRQVALGIIIVVLVALFVRLVFSFFHADPWHPMVMMVRRFTDTMVRPFSRMAPRNAGIDGAAAIAFLVFLVLFFVGRALFDALGAS